jgi:thiosulfate/3-mercaptopyruvate sulfurtransferase
VSDFGPLTSAEWLREQITDADLRLIDFRWYLDGRSGHDAYRSGHIPGAVFVDLEGEVTGRQADAGRHPLPDREAFERAMRQAGVDRGCRVVAYDDQGGFVAGRLWWLLRYFGHEDVAVLDGGLQAWGAPLEPGEVRAEAGDFVALPPRTELKLDYEAVRELDGSAVVIDARGPERFRGEVEPMDPQAGHIPGARSAPWAGNLDAHGLFRTPEELRERFRQLGVDAGDKVVAYCGSGVSACHNLLALEVAGLGGARLYPGSWSDWSRRDGAPVSTGD